MWTTAPSRIFPSLKVPPPPPLHTELVASKFFVAPTPFSITEPIIFNKFASAIVGPTDDIELFPETKEFDFEVELAIVIGKGGRHIMKGGHYAIETIQRHFTPFNVTLTPF